ncbi:hypothetical protein HK097_009998, partial [Rhizophlyctis rosea]
MPNWVSTQDEGPHFTVFQKFLIGASVSLLASCLSSLGVNLQAAALRAERQKAGKLEEDRLSDNSLG